MDKNLTVTKTVFHMSKKVDKRSSIHTDIENTKKTQAGILEMKTSSII